MSAISAIGGNINHIKEMTGTIATAVEDESATTNEMSRNRTEAAKGSTEIAKNFGGVAQAAQTTSAGAANSQKSTETVAQMPTELHGWVSQFKVHSNRNGTQAAGTLLDRDSEAQFAVQRENTNPFWIAPN